jgi:ArsR family transcriptional regulator, arsenate/arsenite/antimonite-responsive transcriptional repressor
MREVFATLKTDQTQAITRALADPYRFAILQQIASTPNLSSSNLYADDPSHPATIAHHLKELRQAGLIEVSLTGPRPKFKLARSVWRAYLRELSGMIPA